MRKASLLVIIGLAGGCIGGDELEKTAAELDARCSANVSGSGSVDVENDYLPHVVACEHGGAPAQTLRAQAVAARSYLYYKLARGGSIGDGQSDQVYSCGRAPTDAERQAVRDTAGMVLTHGGFVVAAFFVAGAYQSAPSCRGGSGGPYGWTEASYVTYNQGRSGGNVTQSRLGWVNPANHENRGCMSQNGASCLANDGWQWPDILRFYYGEDIGIDQAAGACVGDVQIPDGNQGAGSGEGAADGPAGESGDGSAESPSEEPESPAEQPPTGCVPDALEPNNSSSAASETGSIDALSICEGDVDWIRVDTRTGRLRIEVLFDHSAGDIDVEVYSTRSPYRWVAGSYSEDDDEVIDKRLSRGSYWLRIYGYDGAQNPSYSLRWSS